VTKELRIRGTYSQDIRAPNLSELYTSQTTSVNSVFDPVTGTSALINNVVGGNPDLRAEQARTLTYGAVYKPAWLSGFEATVDWYAINIHNAITTLDAQTIVQNCYQGVSNACSYVTRNNAGVITSVLDTYVNLASESASGLDVEAVYDFDLARFSVPGDLKTHLLTTYIDKYTQVNGSIGQSLVGYAIGLPRWRGTLDETYQWGPMTADLRARVVGAEAVQNQIFVDDNHIGLQTYLDLSLQYRLNSKWVVYGSVSNLTDRGTPPQVSAYGESEYDLIGRTFNVGVRFKE
jgi:iron complex outermembrane recepter protein